MDLKAKIIRAFASIVLIAGLAGLASCEKYVWSPPEIPQDIVISFSDHILPLCKTCHSSWTSEKVYQKLFERVDTLNPESSVILTFHSSELNNNMIKVNDELTLKASEVVKLWASKGAENN
ncbi:MAG: hypothetical protein IH593_03900 [Bacteroidales bacterium]|nr:hypothetical protein [Bacteroidales bacterium]